MRAVPPSRPPAPSGRGRHRDPVVAVATAPGRGAVGIVRASGRDLSALIQSVCGRALVPRQATLLDFVGSDGQAMDRGLAIHFPAPHSYTGEDVLELQAHGGPVLLQLLLARCLEAMPGLRLADPGEFTERAFLNDKLDLAQAEAVADLIDASTEAAARSAARSLSGAFSSEVKRLAERLVQLRLLVEATLDFPEEEIDFLEQAGARARLSMPGTDFSEQIAAAGIVGEMLTYLGYEVGFAQDGQEAIDLYRQAMVNGDRYDVVIMDLTIPGGMGGREAVSRLREIDPGLKAIVSSGYSNDPVMADFRAYGFMGVATKPFDTEKLSRVLHEILTS